MSDIVIINSLLRVRKKTRHNGKVDIKIYIKNFKSDKFSQYYLSVDEIKVICKLLKSKR